MQSLRSRRAHGLPLSQVRWGTPRIADFPAACLTLQHAIDLVAAPGCAQAAHPHSHARPPPRFLLAAVWQHRRGDVPSPVARADGVRAGLLRWREPLLRRSERDRVPAGPASPRRHLRCPVHCLALRALRRVRARGGHLQPAPAGKLPPRGSRPTAAPATTSLACVALLRSRVTGSSPSSSSSVSSAGRAAFSGISVSSAERGLLSLLPFELVLFLLTYLPPRFQSLSPGLQSLGLLPDYVSARPFR